MSTPFDTIEKYTESSSSLRECSLSVNIIMKLRRTEHNAVSLLDKHKNVMTKKGIHNQMYGD